MEELKNDETPREVIIREIIGGTADFYKVTDNVTDAFALMPYDKSKIDIYKDIDPSKVYLKLSVREFIHLVRDKSNEKHTYNNEARDYIADRLEETLGKND